MVVDADRQLSIEELVQALDLIEITFYEISAKLLENEESALEDRENDVDTETVWGVRVRHNDNEFGVRIRAESETPKGTVTVDVAAEYKATEPFNVGREVADEFVNNVALMQLFPYIRETVTTMSGKVFGLALLMPPLLRGQLRFSIGDGPELSDSHSKSDG